MDASADACPSFLATLPAHPDFLESIQYQINGLVVVFVALGAIWGLLELMGSVFKRLAAAQARPAATASPPAPAAVAVASAAPNDPPPELFVVVAAAVHTAIAGQPHRIVEIKPVDSGQDWAREGRRAIFASHKTH